MADLIEKVTLAQKSVLALQGELSSARAGRGDMVFADWENALASLASTLDEVLPVVKDHAAVVAELPELLKLAQEPDPARELALRALRRMAAPAVPLCPATITGPDGEERCALPPGHARTMHAFSRDAYLASVARGEAGSAS